MIHSKEAIALEPLDPIEIFIFDWDTLVDSIEGTVAVVEKISNTLDLKVPSRDTIIEFIGAGLQRRLETLGIPPNKAQKFIELYHLESKKQLPNPFHGISKALESLYSNGKTMVLVTNQERDILYYQLRTLGFEKYFEEIYTESDELYKSNSEIIDEIATKFEVSKDAMVMIGDSPDDLLFGVNGGIRTIACSYGAESADRLVGTKPAYICHHPSQLCSLLQFKDLSFEIMRQKTAEINYFEFDFHKLSEKEKEQLIDDMYFVYSRLIKGRTRENFATFFPPDYDISVICAYNGFGHIKATYRAGRKLVIYPPDSKSESDRYSIFRVATTVLPEFAGSEFTRKCSFHCMKSNFQKYPKDNFVYYTNVINYKTWKMGAYVAPDGYFFPWASEENSEVNGFIGYLKKLFGHHSPNPEERYVVGCEASLLQPPYPSAKDEMGNFFIKKTKNLPELGLLSVSFMKVMPNNSLKLAAAEAEWLKPQKKIIPRPRL